MPTMKVSNVVGSGIVGFEAELPLPLALSPMLTSDRFITSLPGKWQLVGWADKRLALATEASSSRPISETGPLGY